MKKVVKRAEKAVRATKWTLGVIGVAMMLLGIYLFIAPILTSASVVIVTGWILAAVGVCYLAAFFMNLDSPQAGWLLIKAIIDFCIGGIFIAQPFVSLQSLVLILGILAIIAGATHFANAFVFRFLLMQDWLWHMLGGILLTILGILIILEPRTGIIWTSYFIAAFLLTDGASQLILAIKIQVKTNKLKAAWKQLTN